MNRLLNPMHILVANRVPFHAIDTRIQWGRFKVGSNSNSTYSVSCGALALTVENSI